MIFQTEKSNATGFDTLLGISDLYIIFNHSASSNLYKILPGDKKSDRPQEETLCFLLYKGLPHQAEVHLYVTENSIPQMAKIRAKIKIMILRIA